MKKVNKVKYLKREGGKVDIFEARKKERN